jgi:hypothetical protein
MASHLLSDVKAGEKIIGIFNHCGYCYLYPGGGRSGSPFWSISILDMIFFENRVIITTSNDTKAQMQRFHNNFSSAPVGFDIWEKVRANSNVDYSQTELSQKMLDEMTDPYPYPYSVISGVRMHSDAPEPETPKGILSFLGPRGTWANYAQLKKECPILNDDAFLSFSIRTDVKMSGFLMNVLNGEAGLHLNVPKESTDALKELILRTPLANSLKIDQ